MLEHPYIDPDDTLSKETRQMVANNFEPVSATDRHAQAIRDIVDTIFNPHSDIVRRLRTLRNSMTLCDPAPLYDIETLEKAITALERKL